MILDVLLDELREDLAHELSSLGHTEENLATALDREFGTQLMAFVLELTGNDRQWAEDVVQETLIRAWHNAEKLDRSPGMLRAWLFTVARRIVSSSMARPQDVEPDAMSVTEIGKLIETSSFGTAGARQLRSRTSSDVVADVMSRVATNMDKTHVHDGGLDDRRKSLSRLSIPARESWHPSTEVQHRLIAAGTPRYWARGQVVMGESETSEHVLLLTKGRVKVSLTAPNGRQVMVAIRGPGDLLGVISAIAGGARSTVTALEPVEAASVGAAELRQILENTPSLTRELTEALISQVARRNLEFGAAANCELDAATTRELASRQAVPVAPASAMTTPDDDFEDGTPLEMAQAADRPLQFVQALRRLREVSGCSFQQIANAARGKLPKSTAHYMITVAQEPERTRLPARAELVELFVHGCGRPKAEMRAWVTEWRRIKGETKRAADRRSCQRRHDPNRLAASLARLAAFLARR